MDSITDLARQIAAYFNISLTESNIKRVRYYCEEYEKRIPVKVINKIKEVEVIKVVEKVVDRPTLEMRPTLEDIAAEMCVYWQIPVSELMRKTNLKEIVDRRQEFSVRAYREGHNKSAIARFLKKDHSTVVHYINSRPYQQAV